MARRARRRASLAARNFFGFRSGLIGATSFADYILGLRAPGVPAGSFERRSSLESGSWAGCEVTFTVLLSLWSPSMSVACGGLIARKSRPFALLRVNRDASGT
jgi:hypothetical protein